MRKQTLIIVSTLIVVLGILAFIVVWQNLQMYILEDKNNEVSLTLTQREQEIDNLESQYQSLLETFQLVTDSLNLSLQNVTGLLGSLQLEMFQLQDDYLFLLEEHDNLSDYYIGLESNLSSKIDDLRTSIAWLSQGLGGYDGVFILNHTYSWGTVGMITTYTVTMELYNALEDANVTVRLYGDPGGSRVFIYQIPGFTKRALVEVWQGGVFYEDFSQIAVDNVER